MIHLDAPERETELQALLKKKRALRLFYREVYAQFDSALKRCTVEGAVVELGSGSGFARDLVPQLITTDVLPYRDIDCIVDATRMPFASASLRALLLFNVFHHIPDPAAFLSEANRVLVPGGRILMVDQHVGWLSSLIYRFLHHEGFAADAADWAFESSGPLSGANGALSWIVFERDRAAFEARFPGLELRGYQPHSPLRYWLAGGLKRWSLLPAACFPMATRLDRWLARLSPGLCSFVSIELIRRPD